MKRILIILLLVCYIPALHYAQTTFGFAVQTVIKNGVIEGNYDTKEGLQVYLGVPFAKPPVGQLRWKAPQPLENWKGIKQTKKFAQLQILLFTYLVHFLLPTRFMTKITRILGDL